MMSVRYYKSPLGYLRLVSQDGRLASIGFVNETSEPDCEAPSPVLDKTKEWLDLYFRGVEAPFSPLILWEGGDFQKVVLQETASVGFGKVISYGDLAIRVAKSLGRKKMSAQAVGTALSKNPIPIVIPCHRIIKSDGKIGGYSEGVDKKITLLRHEKASFTF